MKRILILGVNGFIGHHLSKRIIDRTDWEVYGMDMQTDRIAELLGHERFRFFEGDITINHEWIEYHVRKCDTVLPLVAIATPAIYVKEPLKVFELDFEANLPIVRGCVRHGKRLVFPSTSEAYGMKEGLDDTLFRPFNWIGSGLDNLNSSKEGSSRVITQFFGHIVRGEPIKLVDGGKQKRAFTYIDDGIDALMKIIENPKGIATGKIYNVGNPKNNYSVRQLAAMMVKLALQYPEYREHAKKVKLVSTSAAQYYGKGYQDVQNRVPKIAGTTKDLGWRPKFDMQQSLKLIFDAYRTHVAEARRLVE